MPWWVNGLKNITPEIWKSKLLLELIGRVKSCFNPVAIKGVAMLKKSNSAYKTFNIFINIWDFSNLFLDSWSPINCASKTNINYFLEVSIFWGCFHLYYPMDCEFLKQINLIGRKTSLGRSIWARSARLAAKSKQIEIKNKVLRFYSQNHNIKIATWLQTVAV